MKKIACFAAAVALSLVAGDRPARQSMRVAPPEPPPVRVEFRAIGPDDREVAPLYRTQTPVWGNLEHFYDRHSDTLFSLESYLYEDGSQEQYLRPHTINFDPQDAPARPATWSIPPRCALAMESASNQANAATGKWTLKGDLGCLGSIGATPCNGATSVARVYRLVNGAWSLIGQQQQSSTQINCAGQWLSGLIVSVSGPGTFYCTWTCNSGFDVYWNLRTDLTYGQ